MNKLKNILKIILTIIFTIIVIYLNSNGTINMPPLIQILLLIQFILIIRRYLLEQNKKWYAIIIYCEVILSLVFNLIRALI